MYIREPLLLNVVLPLAEKVTNVKIMEWYHLIQQMNKWSREQIAQWQLKHLQQLLNHAYEHTVYYKEIFDNLSLKPKDICSFDDLNKLPILTKQIINERYEDLIPNNLTDFNYRQDSTGGSTGVPMRFLHDESMWGYVTADKMLAWKKKGYHYGDRFVALGSSSLFHKNQSFLRRIYDKLRREIPLNCINQDDNISAHYVEVIRRKKVRYIYGYAAAIYIFAQYIKNNHIDLTQIDAVFSTSENLTDTYRQSIEETFKCKVMDCYGSRDSGISAFEIEPHSYHVGYNTWIETVNELEPHLGTLLSTNLFSYSMPMIRYDVGDVAHIAVDVKDEEYNGQVIRHIEGRTSDVIHLSNGHNLTATGIAMIMRNFSIAAFNFAQTKNDEVTLILQAATNWNAKDEQLLKDTLKEYIGKESKLVIKYVTKFEQGTNGKRKYFLNTI